jgi:peptide chain release factor 1
MELPRARLEEMEARFQQLEKDLSDPATGAQPELLHKYGKEHSDLKPVVDKWREHRSVSSDLEEARAMLQGTSGEERTYLQKEISEAEARLEALSSDLFKALLPKDPNDDRDVIVEIRASAGGDEAGLFAADLFRMYTRYAEDKRYKTEVLNSNPTGINGYKEVTFAVKGKGAYSKLKHEAGVHRVQRVPVTESQGRIHTSTASVIVLPEADEVEIQIDENDLKIDVYRSSGPGGQSVNTTDSAVRIKHLPTGVEVACQDQKSQLQNREKALRILRSRLLQIEQDKQAQEMSDQRKSQVGSGDRSERIRTYNFPENRVTDHRINYTVHRLGEILEGDLDDLIETLGAHFQAESLGEGE